MPLTTRNTRSASDACSSRRIGCSSSSAPVFSAKSARFISSGGSFDLAVTRFSGRAAPPHPGGVPNLPDAVTGEAYSHEVSSAGFWPGGAAIDYAAFSAYGYPTPEGFAPAPVRPEAAFFHQALDRANLECPQGRAGVPRPIA
jgi:Family of unknown function (DUF5996)